MNKRILRNTINLKLYRQRVVNEVIDGAGLQDEEAPKKFPVRLVLVHRLEVAEVQARIVADARHLGHQSRAENRR